MIFLSIKFWNKNLMVLARSGIYLGWSVTLVYKKKIHILKNLVNITVVDTLNHLWVIRWVSKLLKFAASGERTAKRNEELPFQCKQTQLILLFFSKKKETFHDVAKYVRKASTSSNEDSCSGHTDERNRLQQETSAASASQLQWQVAKLAPIPEMSLPSQTDRADLLLSAAFKWTWFALPTLPLCSHPPYHLYSS